MRITTMIIIVITVLLTIVLMQNTEPVSFTILFSNVRMSKLAMMGTVAIVAFILGVMVGRPKKARQIGNDFSDENHNTEKTNTLSDEDRDYIS